MPTFDAPVEFEVFCGACGYGLCGNATTGTTRRRGMPYVNVDPCPRCLDTARDEGYEDGRAKE